MAGMQPWSVVREGELSINSSLVDSAILEIGKAADRPHSRFPLNGATATRFCIVRTTLSIYCHILQAKIPFHVFSELTEKRSTRFFNDMSKITILSRCRVRLFYQYGPKLVVVT